MPILNSQRRTIVYRTIQSLARSKVPVYDALVAMYVAHSRKGKRPSSPIARFASEVLVRLSSGMSGNRFAEAFSGWLPATEISILAAAQKAGDIANGCEDAINYIKLQTRIRNALFGALAYPAVILAMAIGLLSVISFKVIPVYARASNPDTWTGHTAFVYGASEAIRSYGLGILVLIIGTVAFIRWSLHNWKGGWRSYIEWIPPWSTYKTLQGAIFFSNLAILLNAGADLIETMQHLQKQASPWLRQRLQDTMYGLSQGKNLGVALELSGHKFPDEQSIAYISTIAGRDGFTQAMAEYATNSGNAAAEQLERAGKIIFFVGLLGVAMLAMFIFFGLFGLQTSASNRYM